MAAAIPIISLALTAAATGYAVSSSMDQAAQQKRADQYNAEVADNNAKAIRDQANADIQNQRDRNYRVFSAQRAAAAKAGIQLDGTFEDVTFDSMVEAQKGLLAIDYKAKAAAAGVDAQAGLFRMSASNQDSRGMYGAVGAGLQGAGSMLGTVQANYGAPKPKLIS